MATKKERRVFVASAEVELVDAEPGVREFEFITAASVGEVFDLGPCPDSTNNEDWRPWDEAAATAVVLHLPGKGASGVVVMQRGDERGALYPYVVQIQPIPRLLRVGDIYGARWFARLTLKQQAVIEAWLLEHDLVIARAKVTRGLANEPLQQVVRDVRVMERDGMMLAVINRTASKDEREAPGQKFLGVAPDAVFRILQATEPSGGLGR